MGQKNKVGGDGGEGGGIVKRGRRRRRRWGYGGKSALATATPKGRHRGEGKSNDVAISQRQELLRTEGKGRERQHGRAAEHIAALSSDFEEESLNAVLHRA